MIDLTSNPESESPYAIQRQHQPASDLVGDRAPVTPAELEYTELLSNARIGLGARLRR